MIFNVFGNAERINVYRDGNVAVYNCNEDKFGEIVAEWNAMCSDAHDMPAYGVSLNGETVRAMQRGLWIEFDFGKTVIHNEMPFEKLLVNVCAEWSGFNLIRYTAEYGYDGRCFYFNLVDKNMSGLYNLLMKQ